MVNAIWFKVTSSSQPFLCTFAPHNMATHPQIHPHMRDNQLHMTSRKMEMAEDSVDRRGYYIAEMPNPCLRTKAWWKRVSRRVQLQDGIPEKRQIRLKCGRLCRASSIHAVMQNRMENTTSYLLSVILAVCNMILHTLTLACWSFLDCSSFCSTSLFFFCMQVL